LCLGIASPLAVGDKVGLDAAVLPGRAANPVNGQMGLPFGNGVISAREPHHHTSCAEKNESKNSDARAIKCPPQGWKDNLFSRQAEPSLTSTVEALQ
jgi:hypothetical protein